MTLWTLNSTLIKLLIEFEGFGYCLLFYEQQEEMEFLVSTKLLKVVGWCIEYGYFFRVVPYRWNKTTNQLYVPVVGSQGSLKHYYYRWDYLKYLLLVHQVFLMIRICQPFVFGDFKERPILYIVLDGAYTMCFCISVAIEVILIHRSQEILRFVNQYIDFFLKIQGNVHKHI